MIMIQRCFVGGGPASLAEKTDQMMQRAKRADPTTEKPSEKNGQNNGGQPPQQPCIEGPGGEHGAEGDQRVKFEKPVHRPAPQLPPFHAEGTDDAEPQKERQKKGLAYPSYGYDAHAGSSVW